MADPRRAPFPRRVVHVLRYAEGRGGTEAHVLHLAREYVRLGIAVLAVLAEDATSDRLEIDFRDAGAEVLRLDVDGHRGHVGLPGRWWKLVRELRRWQPDVVHVHSGGHTGGLPILALAQIGTRATVVHTEHLYPPAAQSRRFRVWKRMGDACSDALIAVSRSNAQYRRAHSHPPERRFAAILNGIPLPPLDRAEQAEHRRAVRAQWDIPEDALVYGVTSRLVDWKGVDWTIRAFALLDLPQAAYLLVVGDGPEAGALTELAEHLGVAGQVRFAGYQDAPLAHADAMDVFVSSIPEGSGSIALLEAMSRALPPLITNCGPEEAVIDGESGICSPPRDAEALARAMTRLAGDAFRAQIGAAARAHLERHFSVERVARDTLEVYRSARRRRVPARLRADGPMNPRPGDPVTS